MPLLGNLDDGGLHPGARDAAHRMAYQNAAWQEARVAAEAGIDMAMSDLVVNASGGKSGAWAGWQR